MQTYPRLSFELNLRRQSAVDRETFEVLTTRYDEQNEELKKLIEELRELPGLKEKLAKCAELEERFDKNRGMEGENQKIFGVFSWEFGKGHQAIRDNRPRHLLPDGYSRQIGS